MWRKKETLQISTNLAHRVYRTMAFLGLHAQMQDVLSVQEKMQIYCV